MRAGVTHGERRWGLAIQNQRFWEKKSRGRQTNKSQTCGEVVAAVAVATPALPRQYVDIQSCGQTRLVNVEDEEVALAGADKEAVGALHGAQKDGAGEDLAAAGGGRGGGAGRGLQVVVVTVKMGSIVCKEGSILLLRRRCVFFLSAAMREREKGRATSTPTREDPMYLQQQQRRQLMVKPFKAFLLFVPCGQMDQLLPLLASALAAASTRGAEVRSKRVGRARRRTTDSSQVPTAARLERLCGVGVLDSVRKPVVVARRDPQSGLTNAS